MGRRGSQKREAVSAELSSPVTSGAQGGSPHGVPRSTRCDTVSEDLHPPYQTGRPGRRHQEVADTAVRLRTAKQGGEGGTGMVQDLSVVDMPEHIVKRGVKGLSLGQAPARGRDFPWPSCDLGVAISCGCLRTGSRNSSGNKSLAPLAPLQA